MSRCCRALVALAFFHGTVALAQGEDQVFVDVHYDNATVDHLLYDSGENFSLTNITNAVDHINIWCPTNTWHIGRVTLSGSADTAIRVIIGAPRGTAATPWTERSAEDFMVLPGSDPRDFVVIALTEFDFVEGFDDTIEPKSGVLKCDDVDRNPDVFGCLYFLRGE